MLYGPLTGTVSLAEADAAILGEEEHDSVGANIAAAGDTNGDGFNDVLLGTTSSTYDGQNLGMACLFLGPVSGTHTMSAADAILLAEQEFDAAGYAVAGAGDVDADGFDDLLVGTPDTDDQGPNTGRAYLVRGPVTGTHSLASADAIFVGEAQWGQLGASLSGVGDTDGDGHDDILIGAPSFEGADLRTGRAYLFRGPLFGQFTADEAHAILEGTTAHDQAGTGVAGVGDLNGDGLPDLAVGATQNPDPHFAFYGDGQIVAVGGHVTGTQALATAGPVFTGERPASNLGRTIAGGADVNDDGWDDLLFGAAFAGDNDSCTGRAYLQFGPITGGGSLLDADVIFEGHILYDWTGFAVDMAGDVNGDGYEDIIIGAHGSAETGLDAGKAYLVYGPI